MKFRPHLCQEYKCRNGLIKLVRHHSNIALFKHCPIHHQKSIYYGELLKLYQLAEDGDIENIKNCLKWFLDWWDIEDIKAGDSKKLKFPIRKTKGGYSRHQRDWGFQKEWERKK